MAMRYVRASWNRRSAANSRCSAATPCTILRSSQSLYACTVSRSIPILGWRHRHCVTLHRRRRRLHSVHRKLGPATRRISSFANRDEKRTRGEALARRIRECGGVRYVAPIDADFGGTWIAANEFGVSVCLLNGDAGTAPFPQRSRGLLLRELAGKRPRVSCAAEATRPSPYAPFVWLFWNPSRPSI